LWEKASRYLGRQLFRRDNEPSLRRELAITRALMGRLLVADTKARGVRDSIHEAEFRVFSQFGDDGIIQYLVHHVDVRTENRSFVEFGEENYLEANTRFLFVNDNWRGLVMDGSPEHVTFIRDDELSWRYDLTAHAAFIDAENINRLLADAGFQ